MTARRIWVAGVLGLVGLMALMCWGGFGERGSWRGAHFPYRPVPPTPASPPASALDSPVATPPQWEGAPPAASPDKAGGASSAPASGPALRPPRMPFHVANLARLNRLEAVIKKYASEYGVDEDLVWAVIRQESGFNPTAVSPKGAMGLMQLMPGTAALMGVSNPFDVEQNIEGGIKYLDRCLNQFNQDICLALAAYNAGPDNVVKYQGCPPFPETRHYVASILQAYAGEAVRGGLKLVSFSSATEEYFPEAVQPQGLPWRVPLPKWKIAVPRCRLDGPRWKVSLRPF